MRFQVDDDERLHPDSLSAGRYDELPAAKHPCARCGKLTRTVNELRHGSRSARIALSIL